MDIFNKKKLADLAGVPYEKVNNAFKYGNAQQLSTDEKERVKIIVKNGLEHSKLLFK